MLQYSDECKYALRRCTHLTHIMVLLGMTFLLVLLSFTELFAKNCVVKYSYLQMCIQYSIHYYYSGVWQWWPPFEFAMCMSICKLCILWTYGDLSVYFDEYFIQLPIRNDNIDHVVRLIIMIMPYVRDISLSCFVLKLSNNKISSLHWKV
jgi:hypothetical protein